MALRLSVYTDPRGASLDGTAFLQLEPPHRWRWYHDARQLVIPLRIWASAQARRDGLTPVTEGELLVTGPQYANAVGQLRTMAYTAAKRAYSNHVEVPDEED